MTSNPLYALIIVLAVITSIFVLLTVMSRLDPSTRRPAPTHKAARRD